MVAGDIIRSNNIMASPGSGPHSPPNGTIEDSEDKEDKFYDDNPMWKELMKCMHCIIDDHLCRLLHANGFRSYQAMKNFEEDDFALIETMVQSGKLKRKVGQENVPLHLGLSDLGKLSKLGKSPDPADGETEDLTKDWTFEIGEKKLIRGVVAYIKNNHKEEEKSLGKSLSMYPLFKKLKTGRTKSASEDKTSEETSTVVTLDVPSEISSIKKLVKDYFAKNNFPKDYIKTVSNINVNVKTVLKTGDSSLAATITCPICSSNLSAFRARKSTWVLSNFNRHMVKHQKSDDKIPGTVAQNFFGENSSETPEIASESEDTVDTQNITSENIDNSTSNEEGARTTGNGRCAGDWDFFVRENCSVAKTGLISNNEKYSRLQRRRDALGKPIEGQSMLTSFYPVLNEIEMTLKTNTEMISALEARCKELTIDNICLPNFEVSCLLKMLLETAQKNSLKKNHGQRYEEEIKLFAAYLYIIGGRMIYEFLVANLPNSLPSVSTVNLVLKNSSQPIIEGMFRFQELKDFLLDHNYPLRVVISEDGTRLQEKFCYDRPTNQIIGPVLPLKENGTPIPRSFPATSAAMIANHFKNGKVASTGYAIIAQPLQAGASAFCLSLFGTDNCFNSEHVYKRWAFMHEELFKIGITVECYASDGDPKLLGAMHSLITLEGLIFASACPNYIAIQDAIHTANKFRTKLNPSRLLPIGNFIASQSHVRVLIKSVNKVEHGLTENDIDKKDKMNFNSSLKICSERVTNLLEGKMPGTTKIPGSEGTVVYLTSMRYLIEACLDDSLSPSERLYKLWYCTFFLRYWKLWLMNHSSYNMENFVTSNLYLCVEIITHAITILLMRYRDEGKSEFFITHLFSSQPSESFFRLARSLTSTFSTVINFCTKEFLSKVRLLDMLHHVTAQLSEKLVFPKEKRKKLMHILSREKLENAYMPTDDEICTIATEAKKDVVLCLNKLGIKYGMNTSLVRVRQYVTSCRNFKDDDDDPSQVDVNYYSTIDEDSVPLDVLAAFPTPTDVSELDLQDQQDSSERLSPDSAYVFLKKTSGGFTCMRKSTFCWVLVKTRAKLSTDRLEKVRQAVCFSFSDLTSPNNHISPSKRAEVEEGDWCIFKQSSYFVIGQVLGFSYLTGKSRSYTLQTAPTSPPTDSNKVRGLGCLCTLYKVVTDGKLAPIKTTVHTYKNIDQYVATISKPVCVNEVLALSPEALHFFKTLSA
ncbi:hypothetical protein FOCC_FOCC016472 [Frankliniella occidentalis]|nr:hypothetical protein FOCC_FOCC016472 [Frankliniella occidentalis]